MMSQIDYLNNLKKLEPIVLNALDSFEEKKASARDLRKKVENELSDENLKDLIRSCITRLIDRGQLKITPDRYLIFP